MNAETLKQRCRDVLAQLEGEIPLDGLHEPVEVIRDEWGVPHISARNQHDLFFAQGFVAAQDRLFQIDWWRRIARGETAEILGPKALAADRFSRLMQYRSDMDAEWQSYGDDAREIATAFTNGINACIDHLGDKLPIEFQLLDYRPKKWRPEDCLGRMSGVIMSRNFQNELKRARLIAAVGVEKARQLAPTDPAVDFAPQEGIDPSIIDPAAILRDFLAATLDGCVAAHASSAATLPASFSRDDGSNNWVIPGEMSASGLPLLANDPHRAIGLPSLRYLVHLKAPGWNVIGSGEPALPGVAVGHNERVAWGFTIICTDQADVYVEETHADDPNRYQVGDEWREMEIVREQIAVRGEAEPRTVELKYTRHGPVLYEDTENRRAYALRWAGAEPGAAAYLGSLAVDRATNWDEFVAALDAWKMPSENMIYADVHGNIGWVAAALTPVRDNADGLLPVPGADGRYEWKRFLAVSELPQLFNPSEPIATANHNILPAGYDETIAYEWAPPYRHARIRERLNSQQKFDLPDSQQMQHDNRSLPGRKLAEMATWFSCEDAFAEQVRSSFAEWDGELSRDSSHGPVYGFWMQHLLREFYSRHVPKDLLEFVADQRGVEPLLGFLQDPTEEWFGPNPAEARDRLLSQTFAKAVRSSREALGDDPETWDWEKLHTVWFEHPLATISPEIAEVFSRGPYGQAGDGFCPNATRHDAGFRQISGSSYRQIFDLANWDRGVATSAPGQSGQPESPHYDDLLHLWKADRYFPLPFSQEAVERTAKHRLVLRPRT